MSKLKEGYYRVAENSVKFFDEAQPKNLAPRGLVFQHQGIVKLVETEKVLQARTGGRLIQCTERDFLEQEKAKEEAKNAKPAEEAKLEEGKAKTGKEKAKEEGKTE